MANHSPLKNFWAKIIEEFDFSRVSAALSTISPDRKHNLLSLSKFKEDLLDAVVFISSSCSPLSLFLYPFSLLLSTSF